jgi:UDP-N-acetylmuramate dehydrogenase
MIRKSKLPDPTLIGNAGSFFKNPTLTHDEFTRIQKIDTSMPYYTTENQSVKIPAGWLIEQCGWKGKRVNNIGVHQHQALVLVNYGDGNGEDIFELSTQIASSVKDKFDIILSTEVNIV